MRILFLEERAQPESARSGIMVIGFQWKPTNFKPAQPTPLIHYVWFVAE